MNYFFDLVAAIYRFHLFGYLTTSYSHRICSQKRYTHCTKATSRHPLKHPNRNKAIPSRIKPPSSMAPPIIDRNSHSPQPAHDAPGNLVTTCSANEARTRHTFAAADSPVNGIPSRVGVLGV